MDIKQENKKKRNELKHLKEFEQEIKRALLENRVP